MKSHVALLILAVVVTAAGPAAQNRVLVLEGGTLIDGTGKPPVADTVIVSTGGRITAVGTRGQVSVPSGATVLRLSGRTILPGLIDGHVHLRDYQVPMFLPYGVTTIADIHNDTAWSIAQRDGLNSGRIKGPRMFVSGARVTGPLGPPTTDGSFVRTPEEARAYVRKLKAAGVEKGSGTPGKTKVGKVTRTKVEEIAKLKMPDLNAVDLAGAVKMIEGTARNMGLDVV